MDNVTRNLRENKEEDISNFEISDLQTVEGQEAETGADERHFGFGIENNGKTFLLPPAYAR
jgi:hypothetical protein